MSAPWMIGFALLLLLAAFVIACASRYTLSPQAKLAALTRWPTKTGASLTDDARRSGR
jgi:hypothetical protein